MRKYIIFSIALLLLILLIGCSPEITDRELDPLEAGIQEGHIIDISDTRILVVSDITMEEALSLTQNKLVTEGIGKEAVWYSIEDTSLFEVGMLVRVKSEIMMDSYPGQSEAIQVQIVEEM